MLLRLFSIIAPVFACAAIGYVWARSGRPYDTRFVTRLIMNVGAPFLIVSSFADAGTIDRGALASVGLAAVLIMASIGVVTALLLRALRLDLRTFLPSVTFQNSGNMGLPLCLFAFGEPGLSLAIVVFLVVSVVNFTVGVGIASGERNAGKLLRMPLLWAAAVAVGLVLTGWTLPAWVARTVHIMGGLTIPMMLLTLGVSLASLRVDTMAQSLFFALLRFGLGFAAGVAVSHLLNLTGVARGVIILQSSMPPAVFNYLIAARYDRSPERVAGIVVVSTVASLAVLPAVLWFLLR
jgi:hypothetical protein